MDIQVIRSENFSPYGHVLPRDNADDKRFDVKLADETAAGWRIAILKINNREAEQLHCHPTSMEVFDVISGVVVLIVASEPSPERLEAFLLDKTVCVNKGVWHCTISLSDEAVIRVTENNVMSKNTFDIRKLAVEIVRPHH